MDILAMTQHVIKSNGIRFSIITTESNIKFLDENGGELNWVNNIRNSVLVNNMVHDLETIVLINASEVDTETLAA